MQCEFCSETQLALIITVVPSTFFKSTHTKRKTEINYAALTILS